MGARWLTSGLQWAVCFHISRIASTDSIRQEVLYRAYLYVVTEQISYQYIGSLFITLDI